MGVADASVAKYVIHKSQMLGVTVSFGPFLCTQLLEFISLDSFNVFNYGGCSNNKNKGTNGWRLRIGKFVSN